MEADRLFDLFHSEAFSELPLTFAQGRHGCAPNLSAAPWGRAHDLGYIFYYPTYFAQARIELRHHLIGIEYEPGVVRVQLGSGLSLDRIVKSRSFYFVPAGSTIEVRKENACEYVLITLDPERSASLLPELEAFGMLENVIDDRISDAAFRFRRDLLRDGAADDSVQELVRTVIDVLRRGPGDIGAGSERVRISSLRLKRALDYIGRHYSKKISVEEIAAAVGGISAFHFAHVFRSSLGQAPHQYVLEHKLHRARTLLIETQGDIAGIAYAVGFSSQAHMTEAFSRRMGVTPAQLRRAAEMLMPGRSATSLAFAGPHGMA
ncbi:transcriptional regulator, AraC family [Rhizorhabdus wittichii RW1]|uniref:Transcriptional regulator, AraC family n=2 Tax=Rhizorhabdus wittichii TaxID=160791 RepID=A0A9J9H927_RHIWR|nr:AraC family transcriptional regulator [Rhizorhabdus wittichii]ABQ67183.1 transcriptional regulator, AraC family [Rhizorhabdus wittichii RW1]QTH23184.1 helix-turn-helix transcriptional regulator [Rhizorhabdus wittichii]